MTFLEALQQYILPIAGSLGGLAALIIFVFSRPDRKVSRKKIEAEVDKILAERDKELQDFWHAEFKRLNIRIDNQEKEIESLKTDVKGRDLTIAELTAENLRIKKDYEKLEKKNAQLEERIKILEELLKKYGIDPDGELDCDE